MKGQGPLEEGNHKDEKIGISQLQSLKEDNRNQPSQTTREPVWTHFHYPESTLEEDFTATIAEVPSLPPYFSGLHEIVCFPYTLFASASGLENYVT